MSEKAKRGLLVSAVEKRVLQAALKYGEAAARLGADRGQTAKLAGELSAAAVAYHANMREAKRRGQRK